MAEYRIRETGEIVMNLAATFPNTSLPVVLTQADCDALGIDPVLEGPQPTTTTPYQFTYRDGVEEIEGQWFTKYSVVEMEQEAIDSLTAQQWSAIRQQRDAKLVNSDWWVTKATETNTAISVDQQTYRQALRDITDQADPFNIAWPVEPSIGE